MLKPPNFKQELGNIKILPTIARQPSPPSRFWLKRYKTRNYFIYLCLSRIDSKDINNISTPPFLQNYAENPWPFEVKNGFL
jgi:hypothetical protein